MKTLQKLLLICLFSVSPFIFTLDGNFCFDDSEAIQKNRDVLSTSLSEIFYNDFWGTDITSELSHKSYRPLTVLSFRLNYALSGYKLNARQFKISNLIFHSISCILLYHALKTILKKVNIEKHLNIPLFSSLLFAVHPIHVEAVSGIVGRADTLAAITFFAALIVYDYSMHRRQKESYLYVLFTVFLASVSMLFKENGITVLGICIVYEIICFKHFQKCSADSKRSKEKAKYKNLKLKISLLRLCILITSTLLLIVIRWQIMGGTKPNFKPYDNPAASSDDIFTRIATYNYIYFMNLLLLIWPHWLCFDWAMDCIKLVESVFDVRIIFILLLYTLGVFILRYLYYSKKMQRRLSIIACCLLVLPFLPASNIFFPVGFVIAERVLYIPSAGFCLMVTIGFNKIISRQKQHIHMIKCGFFLLLLIFGLKSWRRSRAWLDERSLYSAGLLVCPDNAKVHYNVAKVSDTVDPDLAQHEYMEALRLYPDYYQAMNNLANLLKDKKKFIEAEQYLRKAIDLKEDFPAAWMNLGIVLHNQKRSEESEKAYRTALKYRKVYPDCLFNLGNLFLETNRLKDAIDSWKIALLHNPRHAQAWTNLLAFLDNTDEISMALPLIDRAISMLPYEPSVYFAAANIYGKLDMYLESEKFFERALMLYGPRAQAIHFANFGVLYHRWKKYKKAKFMYQKALSIDPQFESARKHLKTLKKLNQ